MINLSAFVLLFDGRHKPLSDLIGDIIDMNAALHGADGVHERHLLEGAIAHAESHFPAIVDALECFVAKNKYETVKRMQSESVKMFLYYHKEARGRDTSTCTVRSF